MKKLLRLPWRPLPFLLTILLGTGLISCETDLDPNDSYRETTIIYAVLDPGLPRQVVRINKAFLNTKSNALTIAATQPDSITFPEGTIEASLEWLRADSSFIISYPLERTVVTTKEPGTFAGPEQVVYRTPVTMPRLDPANLYRVKVLNKRTGVVSQGVTNIPDQPRITYASSKTIPRAGGADTTIVRDFEPEQITGVAFDTQDKASVYSADVIFNFTESTNGNTTPRQLTWQLVTNNIQYYSTTTPEVGFRNIPRFAFFDQFLVNQLDVRNDPPDMSRLGGEVIYKVTAGSPQWGRYIEIVNSSSAVLQTTPEYTNVRNGRGLVTGRRSRSLRFKINTTASQEAFRNYPQLKFTY